MAKLSQQLQKSVPQQRLTRTQRVEKKQEYERKKKEFENLKKQAKSIQETEFSKIGSLQEYEEKYLSLSPELRQFFQTPKKVRTQREEKIGEIKEEIAKEIKFAQARREKKREYYERREEDYYEKAKKYDRRGLSERAEKYRKRALEYKYEGYAKDEYYEEYIRGLNIGSKKLSVDNLLEYRDIEDYAEDRGDYEEAKKLNKYFGSGGNYQKAYESSLESRGYVPSTFQEVGASTGSYDAYNPETGHYVSLGTYDTTTKDVSGLEPSQIGKTPVKREVDFGGKEFTLNLGKAQVYKGDKGQLSTKYGKLGVTEQEIIGRDITKGYVDFEHKPSREQSGWDYNEEMGAFYKASEPSGQATAIYRSPTLEEARDIKIKQEKGERIGKMITGLPAQYLQTYGGLTSKQVGTKDLSESGLFSDKWRVTMFGKDIADYGFLDPTTHYKIYTASEEVKREIKDFSPLIERYEEEQEKYEKVKVTQEQVDKGEVTQEEIDISNKAGSRVNAIVTALEDTESYKSYKSRGEIVSIDELVGKSDASGLLKGFHGLSAGVTRTLPYVFSPTRVVMGLDMSSKGVYQTIDAETDLEKAMGVGQVVLGGYLAYSGVKGIMPNTEGKVIETTTGKLNTRNLLTHGGIFTLSAGVGGLDAFETYKRSDGDIYQSIGSGVGTTSTLLVGAYSHQLLNKFNELTKFSSKTRIRTPKLSQKPFIRRSGGGKGQKELVFHEQYKGLVLKDPRTYKPFLRGQQKGTFLKGGRSYRLEDPRVEGKRLGLEEVTFYGVKNGKVKLMTDKTTTFPINKPSLHKKWADISNQPVRQYYLPRKALNKFLKDYKTMGYSSTPQEWRSREFKPDILSDPHIYGHWKWTGKLPDKLYVQGAYQFSSLKGISPAFLRIKSSGVSGETIKIQVGGTPPTSPTTYVNYFEGSQVNPALAEVRAKSKNLGKSIKYYLLRDPAKAGKVQLPVSKGEVEGTYEFIRRVPIRSDYYFKFAGRKVALDEQVFVQQQGGSQNANKLINEILKKTGGGTAGVSSIPSYSSVTKMPYLPKISPTFISSPSYSNVYNIKSIIKSSTISKKPSIKSTPIKSSVPISVAVSKLLGSSPSTSKVTKLTSTPPSSPVSPLKSSPVISPPDITDPVITSSPRITSIVGWLKKRKSKKDKSKMAKSLYEKMYIPDFTSKALGLKPEKVSGKQAQAKIKKIITGLEIRRPVKVKW